MDPDGVLLDVLLVDDEPACADLVADALDGLGAVRAVRTLHQARVAAPADCVVLDLGLPDAVGVEAVRALATPGGPPVVVLTGTDDESVAQDAIAAGAEDYVRKDDLHQLASAVRHAVGRTRRRRALATTVDHAEQVLDALTAPALVRSVEGALLAMNAAAAELFDVDRDDPHFRPRLLRPDGSLLPDTERPSAVVLATRQSVQGLLLGVDRHDGRRWLRVDARPLQSDDGTPFAVVVSFLDVTERREAVRQLQFTASLLDAVGQSVIATDAGGTVTYWNRAAEELYGWSAAEALGQRITMLTPSDASREQGEQIMAALRSGESWTGDFRVQRRDGSTFTALVTDTPLLDEHGAVVGVIGVSQDITARVEAELAARRLSAIIDSTGDAVVLLSLDGVVQAWNRAAEELYAWSAEAIVGQPVSLLVPPDARADLAACLGRAVAGSVVRDEDAVGVTRTGARRDVALTVSPVRDADDAVVAVSMTVRDMSERTQWQRTLEHAALHDDLTGLANRTLLNERLEQMAVVAARAETPLAMVFVDLDAFADVNDAGGHRLGDEVLVEVASRLSGVVRPGDTVARFGGDCFAVLLPGTGETAAVRLAGELLEAVREPLVVGGRPLHVSASAGVAVSPAVEPSALLRTADAALCDAKEHGRGQVRLFTGQLAQEAEDRLRLAGELREALESDALRMVYQPIVSVATGALLGVEALVRWPAGTGRDVPPSVFVPVAERTGLARALDQWVLHRACSEFRELRDSGVVGGDTYLAVNITAVDLADPAFPSTVLGALRDAGLPPSTLVLEVTETGVMGDLELAVRSLTALADSGIRTAIDDFGTGWSSLTYVRRLPASILKIDRSFVSDMHESDEDLAITASVIELGRATGMTVVAEGVETAEQLGVLRQLGCPAAQGWLWQRAVPAAELAAALGGHPSGAVPTPRTPERSSGRARRALDVTPDHGIERLWELHGEGASIATIAAALNREGFRTPSGQRWHSRSVARVLAEPALGEVLASRR